MRLCHGVSAVFDDPNLVSCAGLVPVMSLADQCGLSGLVAQRLTVAGSAGANPAAKVGSLVAGMVAGADSIDDMDVLRHGGMGRLFTGVRAPSTLGTFLRGFGAGQVRQLDHIGARLLANLAAQTPLLPGAGQIAWVDVDDTIRGTHGHAKQGAGCGYSGVHGLNALIAAVSTPLAAPVICATRLREGSTASARDADELVTDAVRAAKAAGATGMVVVRADSAFYGYPTIAAARQAGARFSITARKTTIVTEAIAGIDENAWTPIKYPNAVWDNDEQRWISDAEVAETHLTAFNSRTLGEQITARLIVRRVKRHTPPDQTGQGELFPTWRYHAVFTDTPLPMLQAEAAHRGHAIIEQVIADLKNSALAHLPSATFTANAAWLTLATIAFNLTRAAGCLASTFHARATTATIRTHLITVPARIARSARRLVLHLPRNWPWHHDWTDLFSRSGSPPHPPTT